MAFDGFVLGAVSTEIEEKLIKPGAAVSKIYQLNPTDLLIYFKGNKQKKPLFLSMHAQRGRINFTARRYDHPASPPAFCMLLRKHLLNGIIVSREQPPLERVLYLNFSVINEAGKEVQKTLALEIMGRHSNIILLDSPDGEGKQTILGTIKPVPPSKNRFRTLMPHHIYFPPPVQEKLHPFALNYVSFQYELKAAEGKPTGSFFLENIQGLSPFLAQEIAVRANKPLLENLTASSTRLLWEKMQELFQVYSEKKWTPTLLLDDLGRPQDYAALSPAETAPKNKREYGSISELLDDYYDYKEREGAKERLFALLSRQAEQSLKKCRGKEKKQLLELKKAQEADYYRKCGELILMNLKNIPPKAGEIYAADLYSGRDEKIKIELDPRISPSQNAQRYFKKYRKARQGEKKISGTLEGTQNEIAYLESVLYFMDKNYLQALLEIKEELEEAGYLPPKNKPYPREKTVSFNPIIITASSGEEIYIGRNNRQNAHLVGHFASKTDLWLHVKDMPGAHVILRSADPDAGIIKEAALLAAHFSRGARSSNVPVDYTPVKNIRRIPGAKPGLVTYKNQRTIYVTPDEKALSPLLKQRRG